LFIWLHKIAQYRWFWMENLHITENKNHFCPNYWGHRRSPPPIPTLGALAPAAPIVYAYGTADAKSKQNRNVSKTGLLRSHRTDPYET